MNKEVAMGSENKKINQDKNELIEDSVINSMQNTENSEIDSTSVETENNSFILSIKAFSHNDVRCSFPKKKKKIFTFSRVATFFAFTFFIGVFVYSLYNIAINTMEYKRIEDFYASLKVPATAQSAVSKPNSVKQGNASNNLLSLVESYRSFEDIVAEEMVDLGIDKKDLPKLISKLEKDMHKAAKILDFERAAEIRDQLKKLREMVN
jgi:hypothetical protein